MKSSANICELIALILSLCVLPAHSQHSSPDESLNGGLRNGVYSNDYFDFHLKLPAGWELAPDRTKEAVLKSLNATTPNAENRILTMLYRPCDAPLPDIIVVFSARYGNASHSGVDEALTYFNKNRPTENETELTAPIRAVQFGGARFAREDSRLKGQAHYMADFALVTKGHLLSFQVHAASAERLQDVVRVLSESVRFKAGAK